MAIDRIIKDGKYLIDTIAIHHSQGWDMRNQDKYSVIEALSNVGYERGYKRYKFDRKTGINPEGKKNPLRSPLNNEVVFCMYHYAVYPYSSNRLGFRFLQLVNDPYKYDVGSLWKAKDNQKTIALCFLGDYRKKEIDKNALQVAAEGLKDLILYTGGQIVIKGHRDFDKTDCPGLIYNQLYDLAELIYKEVMKG